MQARQQNGTLRITGLRELSATTARSFRAALSEFLSADLQRIEIDLSQTQAVDSCGLGALVALSQSLSRKDGESAVSIHLLNPAPPVQQIIELTRLHHLFEVTPSTATIQNAEPDLA